MTKSIDFSISLRETNIFKGFAICGMLMWHIFYCGNPCGIVFSHSVRFIGAIGDFCVSAFLLASGYGLVIQFESSQDDNSVRFTIRRLLKLYSNFWFDFVLILLFGAIVMKMPIQTDGTILHQIKQIIKEILAIRGQSSYNDSWWFFSLIISLYVLFPILYWGMKKALIPTILFVLLEESLSIKPIGQNLQIYMPIFCIGILWALYREQITHFVAKVPYLYLFLIFSLILLPIYRLINLFDDGGLWYSAIRIYGCLSIGLMIFILAFSKKGGLFSVASYLGRHSTNIYIIHLMFSKYWFPHFFYSFTNPWLIFIILLLSSLLFSISVEWIKKKTGYYYGVNNIIAHIDNFILKLSFL